MVIRKLTTTVADAPLDGLHENHHGRCDSCGARPASGEAVGLYYSDLDLLAPETVELQPHHLYCQACLSPELRYPTLCASEFLLTARLQPRGGRRPHRTARPQEPLVFTDVTVVDVSLEGEGHPWSIPEVWNAFSAVPFAALQDRVDRPFGPETLVDVLAQRGLDLHRILGDDGEIVAHARPEGPDANDLGGAPGPSHAEGRPTPATGAREAIKSDGLGVASPIERSHVSRTATEQHRPPSATVTGPRGGTFHTGSAPEGRRNRGAEAADGIDTADAADATDAVDAADPPRMGDGSASSATVVPDGPWPRAAVVSHVPPDGDASELWVFLLLLESRRGKTAVPFGVVVQGRDGVLDPASLDRPMPPTVEAELAAREVSRVATPKRS